MNKPTLCLFLATNLLYLLLAPVALLSDFVLTYEPMCYILALALLLLLHHIQNRKAKLCQ